MSDDMKQIVERIQKDPKFLQALLSDPVEATKEFHLTDQEKAALSGNTAERLGALVNAAAGPGCGSTPTCGQTCGQTCGVTFTSIAPEEVATS